MRRDSETQGRRRTARRLSAALALALAAAAAVSAGGAATAPARGGAALLPDLVTLPVEARDIVVTRERGRPVLRFSNRIANRGAGPLEAFPSAASTNCDGDGDPANDRVASQRVFADANASGWFERGIDTVASERAFGCVRYHPAHDHWHVLRSAAYTLRREPGGRRSARSRKVGFCHGDNVLVRPGPGVPAEPVYPFGSLAPRRCDEHATQGISVGYADLYALDLPGQALPIDGLGRGRYCLVSRADPENLLVEREERNNARRTRVAVRPGSLSVRKLRGGCRR
jgi:hypothetical protein